MRRMLVTLTLALALAACGNLFDCYDATLVGTTGYQLIVAEKNSGKRREIHTTADGWTMSKLTKWEAGDDLVVCNAMVTNKTKGVSAQWRLWV